MGISSLFLTVGKIAVALGCIVGISAGLSFYHGFTLKKKQQISPFESPHKFTKGGRSHGFLD